MNITDGANALKETTSAKLLGIVGRSTGTGNLGLVAVTATVQALGLAYTSIERSKAAQSNEADLFSQACDAGTATFFVPDCRSTTEDEQSFFLTMTKYLRDKDPILVKYANIHVTENFHESNGVRGTSYAIISYSNLFLSNAYEHIPGDDRILEAAKHSCDLFIKAKLPDMLETVSKGHVKRHFYTRWIPGTRIFYQRLYFVRFLTIAFGNILVSLQHPPSLDNKAAIKLCGQVIDGINEMLLSDRFKFIRTKMKFHNEFVHFLTSMRREVENLQLGYKSKILNEISLFEVVGKCHGILQGLNSLWHEIIFKDRPNTQPDQLLYIVRCITFAVHILDPVSNNQTSDFAKNRVVQWISKNRIFSEEIIKFFNPAYVGNRVMEWFSRIFLKPVIQHFAPAQPPTKETNKGPNPVPVMEVIKGFSKWLGKQQPGAKKVLELQELGVEINELKLLSSNFIAPMKQLLQDYGVTHQETEKENTISDILQQLIALSIESCPPFLPEKFHGEGVYKNCSKINLERKLADHKVWDLLKRSDREGRQLKNETISKMRDLLVAQYDFLDAVRLFSKVQAFVERNRLFLLERQAQNHLQELLILLLKRLGNLRTKMNDLYVAVSCNDRTTESSLWLGRTQRCRTTRLGKPFSAPCPRKLCCGTGWKSCRQM